MKHKRAEHSIAYHLIFYILLFSSVITLLSTAVQLHFDYTRDVKIIDQRMLQIRDSYLKSIILSVWTMDKSQLKLQLEGLYGLPDMQYLEIDVEGKPFVSVGTPQKKSIIEMQFPLMYAYKDQEINLGMLRVVASLDGVYQRLLDRIVVILGSQAVKTFLVTAFIFLIFQYLVTRHLEKIAAYVQELGVGSPIKTLSLDRNTDKQHEPDELDYVVTAFNNMCKKLQTSYKQLAKSEERFELAMCGANDGVWDWNIDTGDVYYSARWKNMLGYDDDEIIDETVEKPKDLYQRLHPDDRDDALRTLEFHLQGDAPQHEHTHRMLHKDGSYRWILSRSLVVRDSDGNPCRMVGTHMDITDQKASQDALLRAATKLHEEHGLRLEAEQLARVGELSAHIAHEIRNPLYSIINSAALLEQDQLTPEERSDVIHIVNAESQRLQRILDDFIRFARQSPPSLAIDDIVALVKQVVDLVCTDPGRSSQVEIKMEFHADTCYAHYDPDQIRQVLWNLLLNALQAMPEGGVLSVNTIQSGDKVCITITDTGNGIPEKILPKVMEPFVTGRRNGSGLGLSIVERILIQHHSKLLIDSRRNSGTEVRFCLEVIQYAPG